MSENLCQQVVRSFTSTVGRDLICRPTGDSSIVVQTPFVSPSNDPIEISIVKIANDCFRLADRRAVFEYLFLAGLEITENESRTALVDEVVSSYGIEIEKRELVTYSGTEHLGDAFLQLLSTQMRLLDLIYTAQPSPLERSFRAEVAIYLELQHIHYRPNVIQTGFSVNHRIDFLVPNGKFHLVETMSARTRFQAEEEAKKVAFKWMDIKRVAPEFQTVSVINDELPVWDTAISILRKNQSDELFGWTERDRLTALLGQH